VSRSIDVTSVKDFANSINALLVWQSFLFRNQLSYFKDHIYSRSNCWNKIRDVIFFKSIFFLSQASSIKDPTHVIQCNPLIVLYFEEKKKKLTRCKNKMAFPMVFCVSFNLWSWVYYLMVCDEVAFCEFQETRWSCQNLRFYRERLFLFFLALILSACIITSSLIHEATTLMENFFKLWERHLSVQIAYLIKKGF
jgi:hypothetical protein